LAGKFQNSKLTNMLKGIGQSTNDTYRKVSNYSPQNKKASWVVNMSKSITLSGKDALKEMNPVLNSIFSDNKDFIQTKYQEVKDKRIENGSASDFKRIKQTLITNIKKEIKTGEMYSNRTKGNSEAALMKSFGLDFSDMDFSFNDEELGDSFDNVDLEGKSLKTPKMVNNTVNNYDSSSNNNGSFLAHSSSALIESQSVSTAVISSGLNSLLRFQNENTLKFYETTNAYNERFSNSLSNIEKMLAANTQVNINNVKMGYQEDIRNLLYDQGLSLENYAKKISQNSMLGGGMLDLIKGPIEAFANNPLGFAMKGGMKYLLGKTKAGKGMAGLNDTLGSLPLLLNNFLMNQKDKKGLMGAGFSKIFDLIGVDMSRGTSLGTLASKQNAKISFDSETKTVITNVIPLYLSKILAAVSKDPNDQRGLHYNTTTGRYSHGDEEYENFKEDRKAIINQGKLKSLKASLKNKGHDENDIEELILGMVTSGQVSATSDVNKLFGASSLANKDKTKALQSLANDFSKTISENLSKELITDVASANDRLRTTVGQYETSSNINYKMGLSENNRKLEQMKLNQQFSKDSFINDFRNEDELSNNNRFSKKILKMSIEANPGSSERGMAMGMANKFSPYIDKFGKSRGVSSESVNKGLDSLFDYVEMANNTSNFRKQDSLEDDTKYYGSGSSKSKASVNTDNSSVSSNNQILILSEISNKLNSLDLLNLSLSEFNSNFLIYANGGTPDGKLNNTKNNSFLTNPNSISNSIASKLDPSSKSRILNNGKLSLKKHAKFVKDNLNSTVKIEGQKEKDDFSDNLDRMEDNKSIISSIKDSKTGGLFETLTKGLTGGVQGVLNSIPMIGGMLAGGAGSLIGGLSGKIRNSKLAGKLGDGVSSVKGFAGNNANKLGDFFESKASAGGKGSKIFGKLGSGSKGIGGKLLGAGSALAGTAGSMMDMNSLPADVQKVYVVNMGSGGIGDILGGGGNPLTDIATDTIMDKAMDGLSGEGKAAGKAGRVGKTGGRFSNMTSKFTNSKIGSKIANIGGTVASKAGGIGGKLAGIGGLGAGSGILAGAKGAMSGAGKMAGGVGGKVAGKVAGGAAKLGLKSIPGIGLVATGLMAGADAFGGWNSAGQVFNTKNANVGQKASSAVGSVLGGLSFGLINDKEASKTIYGIGQALNPFEQAKKLGNYFQGKDKDGKPLKKNDKKGGSILDNPLMKLSPIGMALSGLKGANDTLVKNGKAKKGEGNPLVNTLMNISPFGMALNGLHNVSKQIGDKTKNSNPLMNIANGLTFGMAGNVMKNKDKIKSTASGIKEKLSSLFGIAGSGAKGLVDNIAKIGSSTVQENTKILKSIMAMSPLGLASLVDKNVIKDFNNSDVGKEFNKNPKKAATKYYAASASTLSLTSSVGDAVSKANSTSSSLATSKTGIDSYTDSSTLANTISTGIISALKKVAIVGTIGTGSSGSKSTASSSGGSSTGTGSWAWPAPGCEFDASDPTNCFIDRTPYGYSGWHYGIDIQGSTDTKIVAADNGTVTLSSDTGYGNLVKIDHGNGFTTYYAHLNSFSVSEGQTVTKGTQVGGMGNTGNSYGTHLHFGVLKAGETNHEGFIDPLTLWGGSAPSSNYTGDTPTNTSTATATSSQSTATNTSTATASAGIGTNKTTATTSSSTTSTSSTKTNSGSTNKEKIWNFFKGKGFSDAATAAIIGNMKQEGNALDPAQNQNGGGAGRGLIQWEEGGGRFEGLVAYAQSKGTSWTDLTTQLEWLYNEMTTAYANDSAWPGGSVENFKTMTDVNAATEAFEYAMEDAGQPEMETRKQYAAEALNELNGTGGSSTGSGSTASGSGNSFYAEFIDKTENKGVVIDANNPAYWGSDGKTTFAKMVGDAFGIDENGKYTMGGTSTATPSTGTNGTNGSGTTGTGTTTGTPSSGSGTGTGSTTTTTPDGTTTVTIGNPTTGGVSVVVNACNTEMEKTKLERMKELLDNVKKMTDNSDTIIEILKNILERMGIITGSDSSFNLDASGLESLLNGF